MGLPAPSAMIAVFLVPLRAIILSFLTSKFSSYCYLFENSLLTLVFENKASVTDYGKREKNKVYNK